MEWIFFGLVWLYALRSLSRGDKSSVPNVQLLVSFLVELKIATLGTVLSVVFLLIKIFSLRTVLSLPGNIFQFDRIKLCFLFSSFTSGNFA